MGYDHMGNLIEFYVFSNHLASNEIFTFILSFKCPENWNKISCY